MKTRLIAQAVPGGASLWRYRGLALTLLLAPGLQGCASIPGMQHSVVAADLRKGICPTYAEITLAPAQPHPALYRNAIVSSCLSAIDAHFLEFERALRGESTGIHAATGLAALGATTIAGVTNEKAAKGLAAAAAIALGIGSTYDSDVLHKVAIENLITSMQASRKKIRASIYAAENSDPDYSRYTLDRAEGDISDYQEAGSLSAAMVELTKAADANASASDKQLTSSKSYTVDIPTEFPVTSSILKRQQTAARAVVAITDINSVNAIAAKLNIDPAAIKDMDINDRKAFILATMDKIVSSAGPNQDAAMTSVETAIGGN